MVSDKKLLEWNLRGLIPGPDEDEKAFHARVERLAQFYQSPPMVLDVPLSSKDWEESYQKTRALFDFSIDWMCAFYSNSKLPPWQGAVFWMADDVPVIQLRSAFCKGSYGKLYRRDEVLAHEAMHAARMAFTEPRFEEMIAYTSSSSRFRRWFGPFFRYSWESYLFVFLLMLSTGVQFLELWFEETKWLAFLVALPWIAMSYGCCRLFYNKYLFWKCKKKLSKILSDPSKALPVMVRLTDKEIVSFSSMSIQEMIAYAKNDHSLRWCLLRLNYFFL